MCKVLKVSARSSRRWLVHLCMRTRLRGTGGPLRSRGPVTCAFLGQLLLGLVY